MNRDVELIQCRAPDKLHICVFYAIKTSKNACIIRSECTHYAYILLSDKMIYSKKIFFGMSNSISNLKEKETVSWGLGKS